MRINSILYFFTLATLAILLACGQNETPNPAHSQAIYWNESIEDLQEHLAKQVEVLTAEHQELLALVAKNPTPDVLEQLKNHESIIARYEGILNKHENILKKHNSYLEQYDSTTSVQEVRTQHKKIHKNLIIVQEDVTQISEEIDAFLSMYDKLEKELDS